MERVTKQCVPAAAVTCAFVVLCAISPPTTAVNVLAIEPLPARSHWTFMRAVVRAMATGGRGHNVTVYTPFASSSAATVGVCDGGPIGCGYVEIPLRLDVPDKVALDVRTAIADFADQWRFVGIAVDKSRTACDRLDRMAAAGHFTADVRYDMVVVELVSSECTSRVSSALGDVPLVYVFPSPMASWMEAKALGTSPSPSYAARLFARYAVPDTLARRLENAYGWTVMAALQLLHERDDDQTDYRKPAVTFVNTDTTVEKSVPTVQNMIGVGGVHLPPLEPIPPFSRPSFMVPKIVNESHRVCEVMDRLLPRDVGDYDLFITEPLSSECVSHAARRLGVSLVYVVSAPLLPWIETAAFGHYSNPAVVPHPFAVLDTFYRRLHSAAMHLYTVVANYWSTATAAAVERRPYDLAPPVKPALVFVNTHHVTTEPPRFVPANRVDVGGIHLTAPQPLPAVSTSTSHHVLSAP